MTETTEQFSIGDVAEATGLSPDTIRVWERRYGRPRPIRLPSGHRRYSDAHIRWLRRVAEALARGQRPSHVVPLSERELDELLEVRGPEPEVDETVERVLPMVKELDYARIRGELRAAEERLGVKELLRRVVAPLISDVGRAWADGRLEIRHEHFISSLLNDFLRILRVDVTRDAVGPEVLFTTLSGETHGLGLQMAALTAAVAGARPIVLGTDTPNDEIVTAARETGVGVVAVSVSLATGSAATDRVLGELREALPAEVRVVVGGDGARGVRRGPRGVDYVDGLDAFEEFLTTL